MRFGETLFQVPKSRYEGPFSYEEVFEKKFIYKYCYFRLSKSTISALALRSLSVYRVVFLTPPPKKIRVWNCVRHQNLDSTPPNTPII